MSHKPFHLAYAAENKGQVDVLLRQFSDLGLYPGQIVNTESQPSHFSKQLLQAQVPVVLLVSDNFLKSLSCLSQTFDAAKTMLEEDRLAIVIIDGIETGPDHELIPVPTQLDSLSQIIQYMNFWQQEYLDVRGLVRSVKPSERVQYEQKTLQVRSVSSEIGEFLRLLRATPCPSLEEFAENKFNRFFRSIGLEKQVAEIAAGTHVPNGTVNGGPHSNGQSRYGNAGPEFNEDGGEEEREQQRREEEERERMRREEEERERMRREEEERERMRREEEERERMRKEEEERERQRREEEKRERMRREEEERERMRREEEERERMRREEEERERMRWEDEERERMRREEEERERMRREEETDERIKREEEERDRMRIEEEKRERQRKEEQAREQRRSAGHTADAETTHATREETLFGDFGGVYIPDSEKPSVIESSDQQGDRAGSGDGVNVGEPFDQEHALVDESGGDPETVQIYDEEDQEEGDGMGGDVFWDEEESDGLDFDELWPGLDEQEFEFGAVGDSQEEGAEPVNESEQEDADNEEQPAAPAPSRKWLGDGEHAERIAHIAQSAFFFAQSGEVEQGLSLLRALLRKHPGNLFIRYRLAAFLINYTDHEDEAIGQLEAILTEDPTYAPAFVRLAEIAEKHQDHLLARHYLEKARDVDPTYPEIHYRLGLLTLLYFPENKDEILECFRQAVRADRQNVDAHYRYATLLGEISGNEMKAARYFKKTLKLQPDHPFANYDLALIYYRLGDRAQAAQFYRLAADVNPEVKTENNDQAFFGHPTSGASDEQSREAASLFRFSNPRGQVAWITGATSGIGRATAELFAKSGYRVILSGRRADRLGAFRQYLEENYQSECLTFNHDVRDREALAQDVASLEGPWAHIDLLVNNAGLAKGLAPVHEADITHWEAMIDTNIKGLLYMSRLIAPLMVARGRGHIINVCSVAGKEVYPNGNVYCATKHAVDALTRAMRLDLHSHGIRVSQVSPGHVEETEFALVRFDGDADRAQIYGDFKPLASPDVAEAILFIATRPPHVTIQDVLMFGSQQASANHIDRSGREGTSAE